MPLPDFTESGDLPRGRHPATLDEVITRFGSGSPQRLAATDALKRIVRLAIGTGFLDRIIIFGSYVSDKPKPNDVDVILVMQNDFRAEECSEETALLFDHSRSDNELGASIFWVRPDMLFGEPLDNFLAFWETKRGGQLRGIVEVTV
ncbi:MAG TPA: hypothetical protein VN641_16510 [Urbifossiella sp.]|nr:hypothetical protein [Urbifossiella sp.]